jgi:ketosteroid isomerase-like protein
MMRSDLAAAVEDSHEAVDAFVRGDPEPLKALYSKGDDVTIANPFGPPSRGWRNAAETMDRAATNFREGAALGFERISENTTADLGYVLEIERFRSKLGGADEMTEFSLRVTTVLRMEDAGWKIVHRHADPITTPRSTDSLSGGG